jgi:hypothetical protein
MQSRRLLDSKTMYKMQQKCPYQERRTHLWKMQESFNADWNARLS